MTTAIFQEHQAVRWPLVSVSGKPKGHGSHIRALIGAIRESLVSNPMSTLAMALHLYLPVAHTCYFSKNNHKITTIAIIVKE